MARQVKDAAKAEAKAEKAVAKPKGEQSTQGKGKAKSIAKKG